MINEDRTFEDFGYNSCELSSGCRAKVWRICGGCGKEKSIDYYSYLHGSKQCMSCSRTTPIFNLRGPFNIQYFESIQRSIMDGEIDELATFKDFEYYSVDLTSGMDRRVHRICPTCGTTKIVEYKQSLKYKLCNRCSKKGNIRSVESRNKQSKTISGKNHHMYGKHHSEESNKKNSESNTGKILSEETKQKISKNSVGMKGKHHSEKTRRKISAARRHIAYEEWEEYAGNKLYCPAFNEECKEANRDKYSRRCFLCNRPEEENIDKNGYQKKLSVHHVDMNKQQGCDGHKWKLVPLCMKCHSPAHVKRTISHIEYILEDEEE